jgi:DNA-binding LacI/PurR family transcriptional regulator
VSKVATIKDVAQFAGVSVATVSRVVNSTCRVQTQTADAVFAAAKSLGFRPNLMGRNLRCTRTKTIGVMLPMLNHPVFAECLQGIETAAQDSRHVVAVSSSGYRPELEEWSSEVLLQQRVDGLILTVADAACNPVLDKLDAEGIPYVLVFNQVAPGASSSTYTRPSICVDNHLASRDLVNYLIELGHSAIHMVAGQFRQSDRSRQRFAGYMEAMTDAGLVWRAPLELPFNTADTRSELRNLLHAKERPTALFCSNDQLAMTVIRDLHLLGLRVPQDVSVVGFDGVQVGQWMTPVLTTMVQPTADIGRIAVDHLLQIIAGERHSAPAVLPHTLRAGGTAQRYVSQVSPFNLKRKLR